MVRPEREGIGGGHPVEVDGCFVGGRTRGQGRGVHHLARVVGAVEVRLRKDAGQRKAKLKQQHAGGVPLKKPVSAGRLRLTAEIQKGHTYYRCTKKSKAVKCSQKFIREEELERQLSLMLGEFALRDDWAAELLATADNEQQEMSRSSRVVGHEKQSELMSIKESMNRLLTIYVSQDIDRESFLQQKEALLSKKKALQEAIEKNENEGVTAWVEPFKEWVESAQKLSKSAEIGSPKEKKEIASKVFGSNLFLDSKKARGCCIKPWSLLVEKSSSGGMVPPHGIEP